MGVLTAAKTKFNEYLGAFKIVLNYVLTDIDKRPRSFKIGVFSIFLVVAFLVILQSALQLTPIIFVRIAEDQNGQYDLTMTPVAAENDTRTINGNSNRPIIRALNITELEEKIGDMPEIAGMSPRWLLPVRLSAPDQDYSFQSVNIIIDSERERKQGIGKNLQVPDLLEGECWITDNVRRLLKLHDNNINVQIDILSTITKLQPFSVGDQVPQEDMIKNMVNRFIENNPNLQNGMLRINIDDYNIPNFDRNSIANMITLTKVAIVAATRADGTLNPKILNFMLQTSGVIQQPLPENLIGSIKASVINDILDVAKKVLQDGYVEVNAVTIADSLISVITKALDVKETFKVAAVVESPRGKWPEELGNVIVTDSKFLLNMLARNFIKALKTTPFPTGNTGIDQLIENALRAPIFEKTVLDAVSIIDINHYALTVNILLNNRAEIYTSQYDVRQKLLKITNDMYTKLGRDHPSTITSSLELILNGLFIFKNFLDNIFNCTVLILIILSVLLIYSLMNSSIEEKTYEFGMLRALGMRQANLITLLGLQSMLFAIPGLLLGMIVAYTGNLIISYVVFNYSSLPNTYQLADPAVYTGLIIAVVVPFASNIIPIRRALSKTLRDSLNIYHRVVSDFTVRILKLAQLGISPAQTVGALTMVSLGFVSYYIAPYSFVFQNFTLFFLILTGVLMLLMIGFTLLINLLQPYAEKIILKIIVLIFPRDRLLEPVIVKNLTAHRNRNTKTSLMFSIALSFLIFSGTAFRLNSSLIIDQLKAGLGADIVVKSLPFEKSSLKESELRDMLDHYMKSFPDVVRDYAFASKPFTTQPEMPWRIQLSPLSGSPTMNVEIVGIDENYLKATFDEYYMPKAYDPSIKIDTLLNTGKLNGPQSLYKTEGLDTFSSYDEFQITSNAAYRDTPELNSFIGEKEVRVIIPSGLSLSVSADVGTPTLLVVDSVKFRARVRNTALKFPGFFFTGYRAVFKTTILTSHQDYKYMTDKVYDRITQYYVANNNIQSYLAGIPPGTTEGVAKHNLLVRLKPGVDKETRLSLFNTIQTMVDGQFSFVVDVVGTVHTLESSLLFIDIFFVLVSAIAISLSFFFTLVSFVSNINENSWEFGILRAVGLNKAQMTKIYIYEALGVIVAAGILGTLVGIIVALTTTIQFNLFTELPLKFLFPTTVFLFTLILSILTSVFGSKAAVDDIKDKQISSIIRALD